MSTSEHRPAPGIRIAAILCGLVPLAAMAPAAADTVPAGGGANNVVLVSTTTDGGSAVRANTQVTQVGGPSVASANIADATASTCTGCHATSVAAQVVFVTGDPQYYAPANSASAVNSGCSSCGTFAYAWQYVVPVHSTVRLSPTGQQQVQALAAEIRDTVASVTPTTVTESDALRAQLDTLTAQLAAVIQDEQRLGNVRLTGAPVMNEHSQWLPS